MTADEWYAMPEEWRTQEAERVRKETVRMLMGRADAVEAGCLVVDLGEEVGAGAGV